MNRENRTSTWKVMPVAILLILVGATSLGLAPVGASASPAGTSSPAYIEFRVVKNYGNWVAPYETPASAITMITNLRSSIGNRPLNLYAIVSGPQSPTEIVGTTTLDNFLLQAKQASGGQIIPDLNLNYYTSDIQSLPLNQKSNYCNPKDHTECGPAWFFKVSSELLSLQVISSDPQKTVALDAWDQFNRDIVTAGLPPTTAITVLQQLKAQGWVNLMLKSENYFPDQGNAGAVVATVDDSASTPYTQPELSLISKLPSTDRAFVHFDRQVQNTPNPITALAAFLSTMTRAQRGVGLTNLASLQSADKYTFIYPVLTYTARDTVPYTWDASVSKQSTGQPFLNLIAQLIVQYN
jgi:hypothetical protein